MIENEIFIIFVSNLKLRIENIIKKGTKIFYKNLGFIQNLRTSKLIALSLKVKLWNIVYKNFLKVYFNYNVKEKKNIKFYIIPLFLYSGTKDIK